MRDYNMAKLMNRAAKKMEESKKANPLQQSSYPQRKDGRKVYKDNFQTDESVKDLGGEFYNSYTFIPFPQTAPERHEPSLLTVDENGSSEKRYTGVLNLSVETISPLLSMDVEHKKAEGEHFKYEALTIGNDVIVPATSIRGSLRTLMSVLSGGTLGYMDKNMWLCQGRDVSMNLNGKNGAKKTELAEVVEPGDSFHEGTIQRGETRMVSLGALNELFQKNGLFGLLPNGKRKTLDYYRPQNGKKVKYCFTDETLTKFGWDYSSETPWKIKLSGTRIAHNLNKKDHEVFPLVDRCVVERLAKENNIDLQRVEKRELWVDSPTDPTSLKLGSPDRKHSRYFLKYNNKNNIQRYELYTYGQEAVFKKGSSALEKVSAEKWGDYTGQNSNGVHPNLFKGDLVWLELDDVSSVKSLQWARWGRGGDKSRRFRDVLPQSLVPDSMKSDDQVDVVTDLFGMIPDKDVKNGQSFAARIRCHNLVFEDGALKGLDKSIHLAPMGLPHPGCIAFYRKDSLLNGYKVYRNAKDGENPWLYTVQGIFDDQGVAMKPFDEQSIVKTVDLLKSGQAGKLKISFRALSEKELSLLLTACKVDWKLGGGKPLGLGHCKVCVESAIDEDGDAIDLTAIAPLDGIAKRIELYNKSQEPVENMRYPRAAKVSNTNSISRSGLQWFMQYASSTKKGERQVLPSIEADDQQLRGYDIHVDRRTSFEPNNGQYHPHAANTSPNAETRKQGKEIRYKSWGR